MSYCYTHRVVVHLLTLIGEASFFFFLVCGHCLKYPQLFRVQRIRDCNILNPKLDIYFIPTHTPTEAQEEEGLNDCKNRGGE